MNTNNEVFSQWLRIFKASIIMALIILTGCRIPQSPQQLPTLDAADIATRAAQTVVAEITRRAVDINPTPTVTASQMPNQTEIPTDTPVQPVAIQPSITPIPPTQTAIPPTRVLPSLTTVPVVCNRAQLIRDVTVEDNAPFAPGTNYVKIWRIKNVGSCTWTKEYSLEYVSGNTMDSKKVVSLPGKVEPNQIVDLSLTFKAPDSKGSYRSDWMLSNPSGARFGVGADGSKTFWVAIRVLNLDNQNLVYNFAAKTCKAEWRSAVSKLPCPGTRSGTEGFVILLDNPKLEIRQEDELTLWTHPNNAASGWISGTYPEFEIKPGHHFTGWVGCLDDSKGCNVTFRLDFINLKTGVVKNLGSWQETYDGAVTKIDLDLSQHAGKQVRFILTVDVSGGDSTRANGFWFVPGIVQKPVPSASSTPTATATATTTATAIATETATATATATETP